jgi:tetratricopeptide (TPR) repeat protein
MQQSFAIDGTLGWLLLALPIALAALAAIWAARQSRTSRSAAAKAPQPERPEGTVSMQRAPDEAPSAVAEQARAASPVVPASVLAPAVARVQTVPALAVSASTPAAADFADAITRSEAGGNSSELAHLYIKQATAYVAAGQKDEAASRLRDAIRVAALNRLTEPHALARLELGDLYLSNGDPTTACEQWQIARNLFHDLSRPADRDDVDKRMLSNGCPTDWVLTDF